MRGAFGKPTGLVARVNIGQILFSVRCKDTSKAGAIESLRRAKYKFPGRQVGDALGCLLFCTSTRVFVLRVMPGFVRKLLVVCLPASSRFS